MSAENTRTTDANARAAWAPPRQHEKCHTFQAPYVIVRTSDVSTQMVLTKMTIQSSII